MKILNFNKLRKKMKKIGKRINKAFNFDFLKILYTIDMNIIINTKKY